MEALPNAARYDRFWQTIGLNRCPQFGGKTVLEIGCGDGARSYEIAQNSAKRVVGIDPRCDDDIVIRERDKIESELPSSIRDRVTFFTGTLDNLPAETFDVVISENTLEHVLDVPGLLEQVRSRLNPGGEFYLVFGPLYHAPSGDHGWMRAVLPGRRFFSWPWGHLLFRRVAMRKLSKLHGIAITDTRGWPDKWPYLDLNQHTLQEYYAMFRSSGLNIVSIKRNTMRSTKAKLFAAVGRLPFVAKYSTINIGVVLENP